MVCHRGDTRGVGKLWHECRFTALADLLIYRHIWYAAMFLAMATGIIIRAKIYIHL